MTNLILDNVIFSIIEKMQKHMKVIAILNITFGIINCLTIVGAIFGVPTLIMGLRLKDAANNFNYYLQSQDDNYLKEAIINQAKFFKINYILIIIGLIFVVLAIAFQILFFANLKNLIDSGYDLAIVNSFFGTID